jgi:hypothetical protein
MLRAVSLRRTLVGILIMNEITSSLNVVRRHEERRRMPMNMNKTTEVLQGSDENPSQYYRWLCKAFCLYTSFDPEATENQRMINEAFVRQAQGDIRSKLQKLNGFTGINASQLLKVATKVSVS